MLPVLTWRMERGGHGLPKVSLWPTLPYPSMPCGRTTLEMAFQPFQGWPAHWVGGLRPSFTPLDTPTPYACLSQNENTSEHGKRENEKMKKLENDAARQNQC